MIPKTFLEPSAIALVGASHEPKKIGYQILKNLITGGFGGRIFPVNLKGGKILGRPVFKDLAAIRQKKGEVLVAIAIPAAAVLAEIEKAGRLGFKNIVIISAGFKESGPAGQVREAELKNLAAKYHLNILGPNCLGFINRAAKLNLSFAAADFSRQNFDTGLAFFSQSGALGSAFLDWSTERALGFRLFVSLGNKAVCSEIDFLEIALKDKNIKAVYLYLEGITAGPKLINLLSRLTLQKPVFVLKAGQTVAGSQAALSHTGSLVGSQTAVELGLHRAGAVILDDLDDFFASLEFFKPSVWQEAQKPELIIVSNAGGPAVLSADQAARLGFKLTVLDNKIIKELKKYLPVLTSFNNPLDLLGDADPKRYAQALEIILKQAPQAQVLVLLTAQTMTEPLATAQVIAKLAKKYPTRSLFASFIGGQALISAKAYLQTQRLACFPTPEMAIKAWQKLAVYLENRRGFKIYPLATSRPVKKVLPSGLFDYLASLQLLESYQIRTIKTTKCVSSHLKTIKFPVVLKAVGPSFVHKSDQGAVRLNLNSHRELALAVQDFHHRFASVLKNKLNYLVVQEMALAKQELILGFKRDPIFGPILMVGQGGIYSEIFKDVRFSLADLDLKHARELVSSLKIAPILRGARGQQAVDIQALVKALVALARLANDHLEIKELDINPLFAKARGIVATDVRIIV